MMPLSAVHCEHIRTPFGHRTAVLLLVTVAIAPPTVHSLPSALDLLRFDESGGALLHNDNGDDLLEAVNAESWPSLSHVQWPQWQHLDSGRPLKPGPFIASSAPHSGPVRCLTSPRVLHVKALSGYREVNPGMCQTLSTGLYDRLKQFTEPDVLANMTGGLEAPICQSHQACVPVYTELETDELLTRNGRVEIVYVKRCACTPGHVRRTPTSSTEPASSHTKCQLNESRQVLFKGTVFQRTVNVGVCSGECQNKKGSCVPIHTRPRTVLGPNGRILVDSIVSCGCALPCYRVPYLKAYPIVDESGKPVENQAIDVGQCVVAKKYLPPCSDFRESDRESMKFLGHCADYGTSGGESSRVLCRPSQVQNQLVRVKGGQWKQVNVISTCSLTE